MDKEPMRFRYVVVTSHQRARETSSECQRKFKIKTTVSDDLVAWDYPLSPRTREYNPVEFTHPSVLEREGRTASRAGNIPHL